MNRTPKQPDDESVAAIGSRSSLEQTVMGVPPPPPASGTPGPPAESSPAQPASLGSPSSSDVSSAPAGGSTLRVAPTISVSGPAMPPRAALEELAASLPREQPPRAAAHGGETLRIEPSMPSVGVAASLIAAGPPRPEPEQSSREQTALSDDYLREARAAALDRLAGQAPEPGDSIALASTDRASPAHAASALAPASAGFGDTHRSVAPAFEAGPASTRTSAGLANNTRGFEPVPVLRAPLAESLSSALGPLAELGGSRSVLPSSSRPHPPPLPVPAREGAGRWLLLVAVALATVAIVSLGGRLWQRYQTQGARERAVANVEIGVPRTASASATAAATASHALLANRPAPASDDGRVRVVSATARAEPVAAEPVAAAAPEAQLAATAGRHVLSGNYAEALPVYRQLERNWPENTAYAAMARLLEKKVGSRNDTRTVAPATPPLPGARP